MNQSSSYLSIGPLLRKVYQVTRRETFDFLVTTSPDDRFIYLGYLISTLFGLPWHCDLREPPTGGSDFKGGLKKTLLDRADLITSPWPSRCIFSPNDNEPEHFNVIPHGFDPADFTVDPKSSQEKDSRTEFLHAGSLFEHRRNPIHFFDAIENLLQSGRVREKEIRFRFLGGIKSKAFEKRMKRTIRERGLDPVISLEPLLNHAETTRQMAKADVCIGFQSTDLLALKIFEYLGSCNPILAYYGSDSPMKKMLQDETGIHWIDYGEIGKLQDAIYSFVEKDNNPGSDSELRNRYNLEKTIVPRLKKLYEV